MVLISDTELSGPHSGAWELPLLRLMSENGTFDGLLKHGSNLSPNSFCTSMGKIKVYTSIPHSPYPKTSFQCLILHQNGRVQKLWFCKPIIINVPMPRHIFLTNSPYFTFPYFIMPPNHVIILHSRISFSHTQFPYFMFSYPIPILQVSISHSHTSCSHVQSTHGSIKEELVLSQMVCAQQPTQNPYRRLKQVNVLVNTNDHFLLDPVSGLVKLV